MAKRIKAIVKPELLVWARESAGLGIEDAAKKVPVKPDRLEAWEKGEDRPTINQLRKLANAYKRPLSVFFLSEPPKGWAALRDFRRLPGGVYGYESPQLRLEIRRARYRRQIALDLLESLAEEPNEFAATASIQENVEVVASRIRDVLGISYEEQISWSDYYKAFYGWRNALENKGVLAFQARGVKLSEMRGFCLSDRPLPVIAVNIKDTPPGRIFTMIHELVHIMLGESGISDLVVDAPRPPEEQEIEVFCNNVAGATLVPAKFFLEEPEVSRKEAETIWSDDELVDLARRFGVSREVVLRRLLTLGKTTQSFYQRKREEFLAEYEAKAEQKSKGFAPHHRVVISAAGQYFTKLVLNSYYQEKINTSDISDFLEVRLKHFGKIEKEVWGREIAFGGAA